MAQANNAVAAENTRINPHILKTFLIPFPQRKT